MKYTAHILCSMIFSVAGLSGIAVADMSHSSPAGQTQLQENQAPNMSLPLWSPSEEQKQEVAKAAQNYFAALDKSDFSAAYGMMAETVRRMLPKENYIDKKNEMQTVLGALTERKIVKTEWVAPSESAPFPGVYAGVQMTARFANSSHYCGYIVLYQAPEEKTFKVMREEINFIEDRMMQEISKNKSLEEFDTIWAEMSARCTLKTASGQ